MENVDVAVDVLRQASGALHLRYRVRAPSSALRVPPPVPPERVDGLWRHTCFEVFARDPSGAGYVEYNFAPSGAWAAYMFTAYREQSGVGSDPTLGIAVSSTPEGFILDARCHPFESTPGGPRTLGVSAVLEDAAGRLSYWALFHPRDQPDFHHADAFALTL